MTHKQRLVKDITRLSRREIHALLKELRISHTDVAARMNRNRSLVSGWLIGRTNSQWVEQAIRDLVREKLAMIKEEQNTAA